MQKTQILKIIDVLYSKVINYRQVEIAINLIIPKQNTQQQFKAPCG